jgi:hypothetical protein
VQLLFGRDASELGKLGHPPPLGEVARRSGDAAEIPGPAGAGAGANGSGEGGPMDVATRPGAS